MPMHRTHCYGHIFFAACILFKSTHFLPIIARIPSRSASDIIRQLGWNRESFYLYNRGGLANGCGTRDGFTVYDCNSDVVYTMPEQ
jgi:hypothetical protein